MTNHITVHDLLNLKACYEGLIWFNANFPDGTTHERLFQHPQLPHKYRRWAAANIPHLTIEERLQYIACKGMTQADCAEYLLQHCHHLDHSEATMLFKTIFKHDPATDRAYKAIAAAKTAKLTYEDRLLFTSASSKRHTYAFVAACNAPDATFYDRLAEMLAIPQDRNERVTALAHLTQNGKEYDLLNQLIMQTCTTREL